MVQILNLLLFQVVQRISSHAQVSRSVLVTKLSCTSDQLYSSINCRENQCTRRVGWKDRICCGGDSDRSGIYLSLCAGWEGGQCRSHRSFPSDWDDASTISGSIRCGVRGRKSESEWILNVAPCGGYVDRLIERPESTFSPR